MIWLYDQNAMTKSRFIALSQKREENETNCGCRVFDNHIQWIVLYLFIQFIITFDLS